MKNIWFISDTHFNHANILTFTAFDGGPRIRPEFNTVEEMNETMIANWNAKVQPFDKVYHLGDVAFGNVKNFHSIMGRLNGKKRLIIGNHDSFDILDYAQYFENIMSWRQFRDMPKPFIACHYPLHEDSLYGRGTIFNVHGHIHQRTIFRKDTKIPDERYINICVEKINYTPVHMDELQARM